MAPVAAEMIFPDILGPVTEVHRGHYDKGPCNRHGRKSVTNLGTLYGAGLR